MLLSQDYLCLSGLWDTMKGRCSLLCLWWVKMKLDTFLQQRLLYKFITIMCVLCVITDAHATGKNTQESVPISYHKFWAEKLDHQV